MTVQIGHILLADHERIDRLLGEVFKLAQAFDAQAPQSVRRLGDEPDPVIEQMKTQIHVKWVEIEASLMNHMQAEETFLFPVLKQVDMQEALALQGEHQAIRNTFTEIGTGVVIATSPITPHFAQLLRSHTKRESELLYAWASAHAPPNIAETLKMRLKRTFIDL
jgi:iron-sulfur cluster repair protein YtfE (RIC family)